MLPAPGEWLDIPDTKLGPKLANTPELTKAACAALGGCPTGWAAWCSLGRDENGDLWSINSGGDADWGGKDSYRIRKSNWAAGWERVQPVVFPIPGPFDVRGCELPRDGYTPPSQHTYGAVASLGNGRFAWGGGSSFCKVGKSTNAKTAFFVDTNTWTWTYLPALNRYWGFAAMGVAQGKIYSMSSDGKFAIVDPVTGALDVSGQIGAVPGLPGFSSFSSQMSAGAINDEGIFCTGNDKAIGLSRIDGTGDYRFGRVVRHQFGAGFSGGRCCVTAIPGGRFALWHGGKTIWIFKPDFLNPANDVWTKYAPVTGPTAQNAYTYNKLFWDSADEVLIGYSNANENVWQFKVPS